MISRKSLEAFFASKILCSLINHSLIDASQLLPKVEMSMKDLDITLEFVEYTTSLLRCSFLFSAKEFTCKGILDFLDILNL